MGISETQHSISTHRTLFFHGANKSDNKKDIQMASLLNCTQYHYIRKNFLKKWEGNVYH